MRKLKSIVIGMLCVVMMMPSAVWAGNVTSTMEERLTPPPVEVTKTKEDKDIGVTIGKGKKKVPTFIVGKEKQLVIPIINDELEKITNIVVKPIKDADAEKYPFKSEYANTYATIDEIEAGKSKNAEFTLSTRDNVTSKDYEVMFEITYLKGEKPVSVTRGLLVSVEGKQVETPVVTATPEPTTEPEERDTGDYGGGGSGGDSGSDDSKPETDKKSARPRVIVEGFRTEPAVVNAGDTFKLILRVRNTSKKTGISNMEINLQAPGSASDSKDEDSSTPGGSDAFMPVKGSNTLFEDAIGADKTKEVSIDLTARADLTQKPYQIEVAMKYEDAKAEAYETSSNISIPIKQKARFELSTITLEPTEIMVGEEANVTFDIYNLGRTKLYNVSITMESNAVSGGEAFVGNLDAGATGNVDVMLTGIEETTDAGEVKIIVNYEDQDGKKDSYESTCNLFVMPGAAQVDGMIDEMNMGDVKKPGLSKLAIAAIGVGVLLVIAAVVVIVIRRKHKKEEDFADEFFGSDTDE